MYRKFKKFFRKSYRKYGTSRRKRSFKRKYRKYKSAATRPLVVKRFIKTNIALSTSPGGGVFQFTLNDLPNASEFIAMFDAYKIIKATVTLRPNVQPAVVGLPFSGSDTPKAGGEFYWYKDYDDAGNPTSIAEVNQVPDRKVFSIVDQKTHKMTIYPCYSKSVFSSVTATGYGPGRGWLDLTYPSVPHYGIKWWWQPHFPDSITPLPVCVVFVDYSITCALKGPR